MQTDWQIWLIMDCFGGKNGYKYLSTASDRGQAGGFAFYDRLSWKIDEFVNGGNNNIVLFQDFR